MAHLSHVECDASLLNEDLIDPPQFCGFPLLMEDPLKWEEEEEDIGLFGFPQDQTLFPPFCSESGSELTTSQPSSNPSSTPSSPNSSSCDSDSGTETQPASPQSDSFSQYLFDSSLSLLPFNWPSSIEPLPTIETVAPALLHEAAPEPTKSTKRRAAPTSKQSQRKRARKVEEEVEPTAVSLPRDQLLKLTSVELEEYVATLRAQRKLTAAEEKDIGRQRRLVKNRESASLSRQRRKEHMDELEAQVADLTLQNQDLQAQVDELTLENLSLKDKVQTLEGNNAGYTETVSNAGASVIKALQQWTSVNSKQQTLSRSAAAAGACLAIILFSFGLFFNAGFFGAHPAMSTSYLNTVQPLPVITSLPDQQNEAPALTAPITRGSSQHGSEWTPLMRKLLHYEQEEQCATLGTEFAPIDLDADETTQSVVPAISKSSVSAPRTTAQQQQSITKQRVHHMGSIPQFYSGQAPPRFNPAATPLPEPSTSHEIKTEKQEEEQESTVTADVKNIVNGLLASGQQLSSTPNNTFVLCTQARMLASDDQGHTKVELDSMMTLLVPPGVVGYSSRDLAMLSRGQWTPPEPASGVHTLLQIRTLVLDVRPLCYSSLHAAPLTLPHAHALPC